jgi:hypothetical protein
MQVTYYVEGRRIVNADVPLVPYSQNAKVYINGIAYRMIDYSVGIVNLELYVRPKTLALPSYLLYISTLTEAQYHQWICSVSNFSEIPYLNRKVGWCLKAQLASYQVSVSEGTVVYYHNDRWVACNHSYQAIATASTLAELLNSWSEATEHLRYDLLD